MVRLRTVILLIGFVLPGVAARPTPRLLATQDDFARIEALAAAQPWAASVRSSIITGAQTWPTPYTTKYGLSQWALPPEGGQWTLWYVCPVHGVSLKMQGPGKNICPVDNKNFTGWPYDQVIYSYRHSDNAAAARDAGLTYRFTGDLQYARWAAKILLAYADIYATYPIKDTNNKVNATSGGRVMAQTLDEAIWLIPVAWAYDLISDSGVLSPAERAHIEADLLRAAVAVIARNDAGTGNWQSWHNAATGAVGFALDDATLISRAIDGKSGFRFQMKNSVLGDGTWLEGAWGYHFFALNAHTQLAEMASRAGIDLFAEAPLRGMFEAPLLLANPALSLPAFNDSGSIALTSEDSLYESAYAHWHAPELASVLGTRSRGREALFWGAATLPDASLPPQVSAVFPGSGNAVLRAGSDHYVALKFGPHGGWHGHYDKLSFVSYARGAVMAVDPGTQSYAAPTHDTWDKVTLAHNTVVADETTQAEATGELRGFASLPAAGAVRAGAGPVYKQADLERTMILTGDYVIDSVAARSLDGQPHRFDWIYHNYGVLSTDLVTAPLSGLPSQNGYQYLTSTRSADTASDWKVDFDVNDPNAAYGSVYNSVSGVQSKFEYSREQASSGSGSGKMTYDFTGAQGYVIFSTPALSAPAEVPTGISLMVFGDGSGHKLVVRIYDTTDERFVYTVGPVDWTGWKQISIPFGPSWQHYLGNADGVFDPPVHTVGIELDAVAGKPLKGALYVDDIKLRYERAGEWIAADFERALHSLRVWMTGADGTSVVTGQGLGPNLLQPVPFVMARRRAVSTQFVTLLEPYGDGPRITSFRASGTAKGVRPMEAQQNRAARKPVPLSGISFVVTADAFEDRIGFDANAVLSLVRRVAGAVVRMGLSGGTILRDGFATLLQLERPYAIQVDVSNGGNRLDVTAPQWTGTLRVFAPAAGTVYVNGIQCAFARDGGTVVVVK